MATITTPIVYEGENLLDLGTALENLAPGEKFTLALNVGEITEFQAQELKDFFMDYGATVVSMSLDEVGVVMTMIAPPVDEAGVGFLIPLVILGSVLGGGFFVWQITSDIKETTESIPTIAWAAIGGIGLVVAYLLVRR